MFMYICFEGGGIGVEQVLGMLIPWDCAGSRGSEYGYPSEHRRLVSVVTASFNCVHADILC